MNQEDYKHLPEKELIQRINKVKKEKNAVILAHNYQTLDIQNISDFCGDSLELSKLAAKTDADMVVFCGVDFMAESAKILSPDKKVLLPEIKATCPMAHMIDAETLAKAKADNPDYLVVAYVNTTAEVKALSDICCTSSNAVNVVKSLGDRNILFIPDKNLANYSKKMTGAKITPWDGYCYVHNFFSLSDIERARSSYPDAKILIHPESPMEVIEKADFVFSTSGMAKYVESMKNPKEKKDGVIIGTEVGLVAQLKEKHPDINIIALNDFAICGTMKQNKLYKVCWAIETENYEITLDTEIINKSSEALERMLLIQ